MKLAVQLTRRRWSQVLAGAALGGLFQRGSAADLAGVNRLSWDAAPGPDAGRERRYRATAQILLLSLPLVRWANVGGGSAVWREAGSSDKSVLRFLEFTGFSQPERAAGLNRLGFIREMSRIAPGGTAESLYFGLMTASPEDTAEDARKALHPTSKQAAYTAIDSRLNGTGVETVVAHFTAPAQWSMANRSDLVHLARTALAMTPPRPPAVESAEPVRPFLQTLADALRQPARTETRFTYAGHVYRLSLEKSPDPKAAAAFQRRGLIASGQKVLRATGKLRRESGGKETDFRLWVEEGAAQPLPLRIEYQARSFLRLIFEAES